MLTMFSVVLASSSATSLWLSVYIVGHVLAGRPDNAWRATKCAALPLLLAAACSAWLAAYYLTR